MKWAGLNAFVHARGFDTLWDYRDLSCTEPLSEWGVEDRCMVDGMIQYLNQDPGRPFFMMGWTTQTHYPYEPTPGVPLIDMRREPGPDQWDLGRYLNVLHETDMTNNVSLQQVTIGGAPGARYAIATGRSVAPQPAG